MKMGKTFMFIVQVFEGIVSSTQKMVLKRPLLMTQGKPLPIHWSGPLGDRALMSRYDIFIQKIVLTRPFVSSAVEDYTHSLSRWPGRQWSSIWYNSFTSKIVLKRPFFSNTGKALHVHSGLQGD